ncbi:hypothetical protein ACFV1H_17865 [Streptomyces virginiae]|uniref:hypothetical protein n=1 Tax=Streptomyces virginiae TaxID=1961 RepID=UPI0036791BA6
MTIDPFPNLSPAPLKGNPTCGHRYEGDATTCGRPATWHVAWTLVTPADFTLFCDEHLAAANAQTVYADRHPAEIVCDMPGFGWVIADPSRCVLLTTVDVEHCVHSRAMHDRHHQQHVDNCPWCNGGTTQHKPGDLL